MIKIFECIFKELGHKYINLEEGYKLFIKDNKEKLDIHIDKNLVKIDLDKVSFINKDNIELYEEIFKNKNLGKKDNIMVDSKLSINLDNVLFFKSILNKQYNFIIELDILSLEQIVYIKKELVPILYDVMCLDGLNYEREMEKNTSIIILINEDKIDNINNMKNYISYLEEDPYYFRKYVLTYTNNDYKLLNEIIERDENRSLVNVLNNIIKDVDIFKEFKTKDNKNIYDIVSKIFIKIPFFNIPKIESDNLIELESLESKIKEELVKNDIIVDEKCKITPELLDYMSEVNTSTYDLKNIYEVINLYE